MKSSSSSIRGHFLPISPPKDSRHTHYLSNLIIFFHLLGILVHLHLWLATHMVLFIPSYLYFNLIFLFSNLFLKYNTKNTKIQSIQTQQTHVKSTQIKKHYITTISNPLPFMSPSNPYLAFTKVPNILTSNIINSFSCFSTFINGIELPSISWSIYCAWLLSLNVM